MHAMMHLCRSENTLGELDFYFHHMGYRNQTQAIGLGSTHLSVWPIVKFKKKLFLVIQGNVSRISSFTLLFPQWSFNNQSTVFHIYEIYGK